MRSPAMILLLALSCFGCTDCRTPSAVQKAGSPVESGTELLAGTYNLLGGTRDFEKTATVIREMGADVVALQEVAPECIPNLKRAFAREYPHRFFGGSQGLLSRTPLYGARYEKSKAGGNGFIVAEVEYARKRVQVGNLHLDPLRCWSTKEKLLLPLQIRRQTRVQAEELEQVRAMLKPNLPTVLMGDFNRAGNGAIHRLQSDGYTDSFAVVTPHPDRTSTLRFDVMGIGVGRRIDFIFHDRSFSTLGSRICAGLPSDHDAVISRLQLERKL